MLIPRGFGRMCSVFAAVQHLLTKRSFRAIRNNSRDSAECEKRCFPVPALPAVPIEAHSTCRLKSNFLLHVFTVVRSSVFAANFRHDSWSWSLARYINYYYYGRKQYATFWPPLSAHSPSYIHPFDWCLRSEIASSATITITIYSSVDSRLLLVKRVLAANCTLNQCAKRMEYYFRFSTPVCGGVARDRAKRTKEKNQASNILCSPKCAHTANLRICAIHRVFRRPVAWVRLCLCESHTTFSMCINFLFRVHWHLHSPPFSPCPVHLLKWHDQFDGVHWTNRFGVTSDSVVEKIVYWCGLREFKSYK